MPVIAVMNQKGGVGKTTIVAHLATALAAHGKALVIDADPQASMIDWFAQRGDTRGLFNVIGLDKPIIHKQISSLAQGYDWVVIDGPPRVKRDTPGGDVTRSAIAAADLVLIPVQPSPFDVWAAKEIIDIIREFEIPKPALETRFVINRLFPNTTLGSEISEALADYQVPILTTMIRNRTEYAKAARGGMTAIETDPRGPAALEIHALASEVSAVFKHAKEPLHVTG